MTAPLVLAPAFAFHEIDRKVEALGWVRQRDAMVTAPILQGEPEFAAWKHPALHGAERIVYTFNPVIRLRILAFYGSDASSSRATIERLLPTLDLDDVRALLQQPDVRKLLLGIFAAGELVAWPVLEAVAALRNHDEALVARAANKVHGELSKAILHEGMHRLAEEKARQPGRSALFPRLGEAHERRQIVRWLLHDNEVANDDVQAALRSALADPDWEVRVSAMLATVRLQAGDLAPAVRDMPLPETGREGLSTTDRQLLHAMKKAALALLERQSLLDESRDLPGSRSYLRAQVMRCVAGAAVTRRDGIFLFCEALTQPIPDDPPQPPFLPPSLASDGDAYRLAETGLKMVWVPPVAHWLGDEGETSEETSEEQNPIRLVMSEGYFIAQHPLSQSLPEQLASDRSPDRPPPEGEGFFSCPWRQAVQLCKDLAERESLPIALPSVDEWEMAIRGPDGRRFPWGNGREKDARPTSPWGVMDAVGSIPQWSSTRTKSGLPIACGGPSQLRCSSRTALQEDAGTAALRPVLFLSERRPA